MDDPASKAMVIVSYGLVPALLLIGLVFLAISKVRQPKPTKEEKRAEAQSKSTAEKVSHTISMGFAIFLVVMAVGLLFCGLLCIPDGLYLQALIFIALGIGLALYAYVRFREIE